MTSMIKTQNGAKNRRLDLDLVSTYRAPLYGVFILWVVLFHAEAIHGVDYSFGRNALLWFDLILDNGNVGVDAFLFLSGISLYHAWGDHKDIHLYLKRRLVRLFVPVFSVCGLYWFIRCVCFGDMDGISGFIRRISLTSFWITGDAAVWYVSLLLVLYLLYPYIYEFLFSSDDSRKTAFRLAILILAAYLIIWVFQADMWDVYDLYEIALTRIPVFLLGCGCGRAVSEKRTLPAFAAVGYAAAALIFYLVLYFAPIHGIWRRFFFLVGGVSLPYLFALLFSYGDHHENMIAKGIKLLKAGFSRLGGVSLEIYLSHIIFGQIYRLTPFYVKGDLARYLVMALCSVVFAFVISKFVVKPLSAYILKKPGKTRI